MEKFQGFKSRKRNLMTTLQHLKVNLFTLQFMLKDIAHLNVGDPWAIAIAIFIKRDKRIPGKRN